MIKAGVIGAFNNKQLISILLHHPDVTLKWVCDRVGNSLTTMFPQLIGETELEIVHEPDWDEIDVVFVCSSHVLHEEQMREMCSTADLRIIDLTHRCPVEAVMGLSELNRKLMVHGCQRVACPDPVHHLLMLSLLPLARNQMLAGDVHATLVGVPDMRVDFEQVPQRLAADLAALQSSFAAQVHILPLTDNLNRGLLAVVSLDCSAPLDVVEGLFEQYYDDHHFTYLVHHHPRLDEVLGTNKCLISLNQLGKRLVVTAVLDNAVKGTAGTAVHDMNLLFGLDERVGLTSW
ncbi:MAG: hypothetical protein IJT30_00045 [Muribaculaceae bacterium]|nr:hypothetical protein [Muribaculaceae bacterium]